MEGFKPGAECAECKGRCCKEKGCSLSPQDMLRALHREEVTFEEEQSEEEMVLFRQILIELLADENGLYAIDYFNEKSGPCFYLRMRHKCYTFIGVDAIGECVALTDEGCELTESDRPKGGRYLESKPQGACVQHYTREQMCEDWAPYRDVLKSIWEEYHAGFEEDGTFNRCDDAYFAWLRSRHSMTNK